MLKRITILIMDSEKNSCEEMQEFLMKEGFSIFSADSAAKGTILLQQIPVDILILDLHQADANGLDLLKEYKSLYPKLDVIVISGYGDIDCVIQAMRLGVLDFLRKPLRQTDLRMAIQRSQKKNSTGYNLFRLNEKTLLPTLQFKN